MKKFFNIWIVLGVVLITSGASFFIGKHSVQDPRVGQVRLIPNKEILEQLKYDIDKDKLEGTFEFKGHEWDWITDYQVHNTSSGTAACMKTRTRIARFENEKGDTVLINSGYRVEEVVFNYTYPFDEWLANLVNDFDAYSWNVLFKPNSPDRGPAVRCFEMNFEKSLWDKIKKFDFWKDA